MELRLLAVREHDAPAAALDLARLRACCDHVALDARVLALGYRFYQLSESGLPPVFVKRFAIGGEDASVALLAGIDPASGDGVAGECRGTSDAARRVGGGPPSVWLLRLTLGARLIPLEDLTGRIASEHPAVFERFAAELRAVEPYRRSSCPLCSAQVAAA